MLAVRPYKLIKPLAEKQSVGAVPMAEVIEGVRFTIAVVVAGADGQLSAIFLMIKL